MDVLVIEYAEKPSEN